MDKEFLRRLSDSAQLLEDIDDGVTAELVTVIKIAGISNCNSHFMAFADLDSALQMYKDSHAHTSLVDIVYQQRTRLFDIKIDKVGLEIISLTLDDIKQLANMPID